MYPRVQPRIASPEATTLAPRSESGSPHLPPLEREAETREDFGTTSIVSHASTLATPISLGPSIDIPFQASAIDVIGSLTPNTSFDPATFILADFGRLYRHVQLLSLEAAVTPSEGMFSPFPPDPAIPRGVRIEACWTARNTTLSSSPTNVSGGRRLLFSTAFVAFPEFVLPCPLGVVNPVLKDSVAYSDTPLFWYNSDTVGVLNSAVVANVIFRGVVRLSSPALVQSA